MVIRTLALVFFAALIGSGSCQKRTKIGTSIAGSEFQVPAVDFECPEEFGYYPSGTDCTRYYVCVFGGALLESCSGGLVYSHELQTCDWPRNVDCAATQAAALPVKSSNSRTSSPINQFITSDKAPITSFATGRPSKELATPVSFQDFEKDVVTKSDRQGKAFEEESAPSFNPNRNSNFRSTFFEDEDSIEEDFVPATTFNPASRFNKRPAIAKPQQADQFRVSQSPFAPAPIRPTPTTQRSTDLDFFQFQEEKEEIRAPISENPTTPAIDYYDESIEYEDLLEDFVTDRNRPVDTFYEDYDLPASAERTTQSPVTIRRTTTARPTTTTTRTTTTIPTTTTARTTTTTTTTPRPRVSSEIKSKLSSIVRGGSRFQPSAETSANRGETKTNRNRPTLKPVSKLAPSKAEPIDIFKHPPRRLEPIFAQPIPDVTAAKCEEEICRLPDCFCGGKQVPGGLKLKDLPQIVLLTFDDSVNDLNKELYQDLFEQERFNPNGCPISATFYVSHEWTDYGQVQNLYADGHEIASHTISHSFGEQFSAKKWAKEAAGQRDVLATYGGVRLEDVRGLRAPFLSVGGNRMFKMLYDMNFTYDSSMPVYENTPPSWPYTLDYKIFHDCMIPPCPTKSYPGVWEVPMVMWQDLNGGRCSMGDGCSNPPDAEGVYKMLIKNFERHYTTNRAPFPLYYHSAWFTTVHHKEGFMAFLDTIVAMDNVWLTTNWQAIQWMRDPTPLDRIKSFKPFQCDYPERPKKCKSAKVCNAWHKSGVRYMRTCQPCPEVFPWTGKTGIKNVELDNYID